MTEQTGFSEQERAAMQQRAAELRAEARGGKGAKKAEADEAAVLKKHGDMPPEDRVVAQKLHELIADVAPQLAPKLYYGQPGYALDGKVVCFYRSGGMDKERYSTLGFSQLAKLDDGGLWPTAYALTEWNGAVEKAIAALVKRAVG